MAIKPRGKGIPPVTKYAALSAFANGIVVSMTGNGNFAVPSPALATITAAQVALDADIAAWGPVGARGSHLDLMTMRADAFTLRNLLVQELGYVMNTVIAAGGDYAAQTAALVSSGYSAKNAPVPQGVLGPPENFHQQFLNRISIYFVGLRWKKPVGLNSPGNVKAYQVYRGLINNFNDAQTIVIATTTRTSYIDRSIALDRNNPYYYWITASNDAGIGAPTAAVVVAAIP